MAQSGTSNRTVREALALLRSEGLIESPHGMGVFVRRPPLVRRIHFNRFEQVWQAGASLFETEVLEQGQVPDERREVRRADSAGEARVPCASWS